MGLLKLAALGALGYVGYKFYEKHKADHHCRFRRTGRGATTTSPRCAIRARMRWPTSRSADWSPTDEESDESFPGIRPAGELLNRRPVAPCATSHSRTAPARPGGLSASIRSASIRATSALSGTPSRAAASRSMSQNSGSRLIDVLWPAISTERLTGG